MALFFDLNNIKAEAKGNHNKFFELLKMLHQKGIPKRRPGMPKLKLTGNSYLINPRPLLESDKGVDILYKMQYVELAARRDYSLYKLYGIKTLPLSYYPDLNLQAIKHNPLLTIINNEIHFKYE